MRPSAIAGAHSHCMPQSTLQITRANSKPSWTSIHVKMIRFWDSGRIPELQAHSLPAPALPSSPKHPGHHLLPLLNTCASPHTRLLAFYKRSIHIKMIRILLGVSFLLGSALVRITHRSSRNVCAQGRDTCARGLAFGSAPRAARRAPQAMALC